jgi:prefoldin subunit 5
VNMLQIKIEEVNNNLSKYRKDMESRKRFIESKLQSLDRQSLSIDSYLKVLETTKEKRDVQKRFLMFASQTISIDAYLNEYVYASILLL